MALPSKKKRIIRLNVDLGAELTGFGSSTAPTDAHHRIMKHYSSPLILGPPKSDLLLELVTHMYTDDEAELVQYIPPLRSRTARRIARRTGRAEEEVSAVLDNLAENKVVLLSYKEPRKYAIMPIVPGTFEAALMTTDLTTRNSWHRRFAELFEELWDTGFMVNYAKTGTPPVRYLPVEAAGKTLYAAWPSDHLEELLEPFELFAVGNCQCRVAMQLVGKGCGKSTENCVSYGPSAQLVIDRGLMRLSDKEEIIALKRAAEKEGCVTWMMNQTHDPRGSVSCSCCGCCCHMMRSLGELNAPGMICKPHFTPEKTDDKCTMCGVCTRACPTEAWTVSDEDLVFNPTRCVGCGICVVSCKFEALELKPAKRIKLPKGGWTRMLMKHAPGYLSNSMRIWGSRLFK